MSHPYYAYSWNDGLNILSQAKRLDVKIAISLQLKAGLREGEIFGNPSYAHTKYLVKAKDSDEKIEKICKAGLKPLTLSDINLDKSNIVLHGKGGTVFLQPIDSETVSLIREYLTHRRIGKDSPLFSLSTRHYQNIVKKLALQAGIPNSGFFTTHKLRAIFITRVGRKKGPLVAQTLARHKSIAMTSIYMRPTDEEKQADYKDIFEAKNE